VTGPLRIGTRGSQLALWQATTVGRLLGERTGRATEIVIIRTSGDEPGTGRGPLSATLPTAPLPALAHTVNVKRLFVKEIEEALIDGRIDLAVHSSKDMPADQPDGLVIGGVLPREDPRDALVLASGVTAPSDLQSLQTLLGRTPRIGTSSVRRIAQLTAAFPAATFVGIRGNLDTRLRKLDEGDCEAIVLASAGLLRLGFGDRISWPVPFDVCLPSPGQGIIALEVREDADAVRALVAAISDRPAAAALAAERAVVSALGGGCQMPIGAMADVDGARLHARGVVLSADGTQAVRAEAWGTIGDPAGTGGRLAQALLDAGAGPLLALARTDASG
jgi:hydroxymethylbilane synthase